MVQDFIHQQFLYNPYLSPALQAFLRTELPRLRRWQDAGSEELVKCFRGLGFRAAAVVEEVVVVGGNGERIIWMKLH